MSSDVAAGDGRAAASVATAGRAPRIRGVSLQLFASGRSDPRARRPVDGVRAVVFAIMLVGAALIAEIGHDLDQRLSDALTAFPGFLRALWECGFWAAVGWSGARISSVPNRGCGRTSHQKFV